MTFRPTGPGAAAVVLAGIAVVAGCSTLSVPSAGASRAPMGAAVPGDPIRVIAVKQVNPRLADMTMSTPALATPVHVDVLLPDGYSSRPNRRYPVIYFLHGGTAGPNTGTEYQQWIEDGDAEQIIGTQPVIGIFPEGGSGGWYTNWYNDGKGGQPEWETFHVRQLVPWVDHRYRTVADRNGRALVGLSMGGYGAMEYAARFPSVFATVAAFSGAVDLDDPPNLAGPKAAVIVGIMAKGGGGTATGPFGNINANEIVWRDHDPADLAANLGNTNLYLYCGNGKPGPLDTATTATDFSEGIEQLVYQSNLYFDARLRQLHITAHIDNYGPGTHSWPYWQRDLRGALPKIMADFAHPRPAPKEIAYTTADPSYTAWGWSVRVQRPAEEFSTLSDAGTAGFVLKGSGTATVTTPGDYVPRSSHQVVVTDTAHHATRTVRADGQGRITIGVDLGPGNATTEYTPGWQPADTKVLTASVTIR